MTDADPTASPTAWPPPRRPEDRYERAPVRTTDDAGTERIARPVLRVVVLWGRNVLVDKHGRVRCHACQRLYTVEHLAAGEHEHPVGPAFAIAPDAPLWRDEQALRDQIEDLYGQGLSAAQIITATGCTDATVERIRAEHQRRAQPPPAPPRWVR